VNDWFEVDANVPIVLNSQEVGSGQETLGRTNATGFGNARVSLLGKIPTKDFETTGIFSIALPADDKDLGENGISTSLGVTIAKVLRPAFVYGGISWEHDWKTEVDGVGYSIGFGLALNHALSVGTGVQGTIVINPVQGDAQDTALATVKLSYQATPSFGISPRVDFGLTSSVPDVRIGADMTWRF
jgi:hypothetical protein